MGHGGGTALKNKKFGGSLEFFIDVILYDSWVESDSNSNEYQEYFLEGKGGRCLGLKTLLTLLQIVMKSRNLTLLELSGPV